MNKVFKGDSIEILRKLEDKSVDVIFADPPYFMQTKGKLERFDGSEFKGVDDEWDKFDSYKKYDEFTKDWLKECKRILKNDGSIWVIGTYHNLFRMGYIMQDLGFWILNDVVWYKSNPTPNFKGTKFVNAQETMIWATKSQKSKFTFNYKTMKELNEGKQMKSVWQMPISSGNERLKNSDGKKLHNTQKPIKLLEWVILSSTKKGDTILDPFFGTGTTGAAAKSLGRNYIGIEREDNYFKAAKERIKNQKKNTNYSEAIINNELDIKKPNVPIKKLIESKYITTKFLFNSDETVKVKLLNNGHTDDGEETLSIHHMSGKKMGLDNYNGWTYWFVKVQGKLISIDDLREKFRNDNR